MIDISSEEIRQAILNVAKSVAKDLKSNHTWQNQTGNLSSSINVYVEDEDVKFHIEADYASFVDKARPFSEELKQNIEDLCISAIENLLEDK